MRGSPRSEQGSTLVEVLVSVVILGLAAAALLGGMTTTLTSSSISRQQADAQTILSSAGEVVTDNTLIPYTSCENGPAYDSLLLPVLTSVLTVPPGYVVHATPATPAPYWNGSNWGGCGPGTHDNLQLITIKVTSPNQVSWSRDVVKRAS